MPPPRPALCHVARARPPVTIPASANARWLARSRAAVWHPCTQMKAHETLPLVPIARGEGAWLVDFDGRRYLDAVSSWWTNLFGHAHPAINAALKEQLDQLEHAMLAGFTHRPVVELSERLAALAPAGLGHAFYASDGASAVEIALKMAFHTWRNRGRPEKTGFVSLAGSYHGETLGALAVTDVPLFRDVYAPLLRRNAVVPSPDARAAAGGRDGARRRRARGAGAGGASGSARRHHRRADPRAARAGRRRHGRARPALPRPRPRALHAARRAADRRRDHDRLRSHRNDVRVGAGAGAGAGLPVPVEGTHRRLPAAVVRADDRRRLRCVLRRRPRARVPAFAQLHRQSARVPRGARHARPLPRRRRDRPQPRARRALVGAGGAARRASAGTPLPATRYDRCLRGRHRPARLRALVLRAGPRARPAAAADRQDRVLHAALHPCRRRVRMPRRRHRAIVDAA